MRVLCILLPHFPLRCEVQRHQALENHPTIILQAKDGSGSQKLVFDFSPELEHLQPGMPLQQALSRYGEAALVQADIPHYRLVFNGILDTLETISPLVEGSEPGCAYIGIDGLQLLYQNDDAITNAVREAIPETFRVQTGIAEGKFLAYLTAMYAGTQYMSTAGDITTSLKDLPCDILPISTRNKSKLHDFGIHTLGQIRKLPPGPLQAQFGQEGKRILELASGCDNTPLYPRFMERTIEESTILPSVTVSLETILATVESLLSRIFARNGMKGRGIYSLTLWTRTWDGLHWERRLHFKEPAMDTKGPISRVKLALQNYPQPGPVEQVGLKVTGLGYGYGRQKSLFSEVREQDNLMKDIRQLELRLGTPQVFKVQEVEPWSRIPERRYALKPLN